MFTRVLTSTMNRQQRRSYNKSSSKIIQEYPVYGDNVPLKRDFCSSNNDGNDNKNDVGVDIDRDDLHLDHPTGSNDISGDDTTSMFDPLSLSVLTTSVYSSEEHAYDHEHQEKNEKMNNDKIEIAKLKKQLQSYTNVRSIIDELTKENQLLRDQNLALLQQQQQQQQQRDDINNTNCWRNTAAGTYTDHHQNISLIEDLKECIEALRLSKKAYKQENDFLRHDLDTLQEDLATAMAMTEMTEEFKTKRNCDDNNNTDDKNNKHPSSSLHTTSNDDNNGVVVHISTLRDCYDALKHQKEGLSNNSVSTE